MPTDASERSDPLAGPQDRDEIIQALAATLSRACRRLAEAGKPQLAGRLAADGWSVLRTSYRKEALRLDGVMHRIARIEAELEETHRKEAAMADTELDVRSEEPRRRHELIFETWHALEPGTAYILVNDHDPKPLYYQFEAEHQGQYSWEYLEEGPTVWRVRIGRV